MIILVLTGWALAVILLTVGYRKNNRNVLLVAAILLFLTGIVESAAEPFFSGFFDSFFGN